MNTGDLLLAIVCDSTDFEGNSEDQTAVAALIDYLRETTTEPNTVVCNSNAHGVVLLAEIDGGYLRVSIVGRYDTVSESEENTRLEWWIPQTIGFDYYLDTK